MDESIGIMLMSSIVIMFLSLLSVSYKTGFVSIYGWSLVRRNRPKFEVEKNKIGPFLGFTISAFVLNIAYGLLIVQDLNEIEGIIILGLFNTVFIAYGLLYWVLLKEKKKD